MHPFKDVESDGWIEAFKMELKVLSSAGVMSIFHFRKIDNYRCHGMRCEANSMAARNSQLENATDIVL